MVVMDDFSAPYAVGIYKKITGIKKFFQRNLEKVSLLYFEGGKYLLDGRLLEVSRKGILGKISEQLNLYKQIQSVVCDYDVLYIRNFPKLFFFTHFLNLRNKFVILEIPTNSSNLIKELMLSRINILLKVKELLFLTLLQYLAYRKVDYIVSMGTLGFLEKIFKNKLTIIENGIDLDLYEVREKEIGSVCEKINLISVSNLTLWQGLDRVILGLADYYKEKEASWPSIYFHIVGDGEYGEYLREMVKKYDLEEYIKFHGVLLGEKLQEIYQFAHIGVGAIGIHRKNQTNSQALKHREYCALGMPFLASERDLDRDFPQNCFFIYRVPHNDTPLDIRKLVKWYYNLLKTHPDYTRKIRDYAIQNLSWDAKLKPVLERIKNYNAFKSKKVLVE